MDGRPKPWSTPEHNSCRNQIIFQLILLTSAMDGTHSFRYKLSDALAVRAYNTRVWAADHRRVDGSYCKKYRCLPVIDFTERLISHDRAKWWYYEVVTGTDHCKFYLDIEVAADLCLDIFEKEDMMMRLCHVGLPPACRELLYSKYIEIARQPLDHAQCEFMYIFYRESLREFLIEQGHSPTGLVLLNSSRETKFSIHIIHRDLVFDRNWLSLKYFVWEFSRYLWVCVNTALKRLLGPLDDVERLPAGLIRLLLLHVQHDHNGWRGVGDTGVDEGVYKKNQCFRIVGSSKAGGNRPLFQVEEIVHDRGGLADIGEVDFLGVGPRSLASLQKTLLVPETLRTRLIYKPSRECRYYAALCVAFTEVHQLHPDDYPPLRSIVNPYIEDREGVRLFNYRNRGRGAVPTLVQLEDITERANANLLKTTVIDDDATFRSGVDYEYRPLREYAIGDTLFHDCSEEMEGAGLDGRPSAFMIRGRREGSPLVWCFACSTGHFVLETYTSTRYRFHEESCHTLPYRDANGVINKMPNICTREMSRRKLSVIDAPCGAGKTYQMFRYNRQALGRLAQYPLENRRNVLAPYYRKALAITMSKGFGLVAYTTITERNGRYQGDGSGYTWRRVSLCVNSIWRIPEELREHYDLVILDEAGFLRRHFVSDTWRDRAEQSYFILGLILRHAKKVICAQYDLHERDVLFYTNKDWFV
ncbi:origin of replication binding protein [Nitzschia inconspicua]|uniref:DNA-directed primase/polymerase protein n=1 Tax=Nitzschia inconspicua TaxID=303405 RepID=A0A9K3Q428_9STRA|nr:origin of replication binding protein [Nitzschia inconspicua]